MLLNYKWEKFMKDNDKILIRLNEILKKLSADNQPRIKDLAKEFNVTERTIQRDIYQRLHYFPIEKNPLGQLQFVKGFIFDNSLLDSDEIMFIYLALSQIKENHPDFNKKIDTIVNKLLKPQALQKNNKTVSTPVNQKIVSNIESAMLRNNVISIQLNEKKLDIKPYKLLNTDTSLLLLAEDCKDGEVKTVEVKDIKEVTRQSTRFKVKRSMEETLNNVHAAWFQGALNMDMER